VLSPLRDSHCDKLRELWLIILSIAPLVETCPFLTTFSHIPFKGYISLAAFILVALKNDQHVEIQRCPKFKNIPQRGFRATLNF